MKIYISPKFGKENAQGGIKRVWEIQHKYFPSLGIKIVDDLNKADIAACHATEVVDHPNIVAHNHGLYWDGYDWPNWAHKANSKLIDIIKKATVTTTPSEWVANSIRRGMLVDPVVCYHGIEVEEWEPVESRGYVIWAKTRVDPICSVRDMSLLASKAKGVQFVSTLGEGTENVSIVGVKPFHEMKPIIQSADVYLATVMETGGITVLEAMASAVPVVGWDWGANSEIVDHKVNGYLARPGDYNDLLEGLMYCRSNRKRLGENARQSVKENFQWKDVIGQYRNVYEQALEGREGPKVSVIVTAHKLEEYLPTCIDSVIKQDFTDWELIIVDDASPDRCGEIADEAAKNDNRIKVIHNSTNQYLAEARNIGIRKSGAPYIIPLDADDQLGDRALSILSTALDNDRDLDIVTGSMELIEEDGRRWVSTWPPFTPSYNEQIKERNQVPYASMYRRWVWERTGGYRRRHRTAEDADFWTRAMSFGATPAKVTKSPTLIYANRSDSMSHTISPIPWTSWFTWSKFPSITPWGASGEPPTQVSWPIHIYGPPKISVVIPCGSGHEWYLQDALDSLIAQTFLEWEVIVVNDTDISWMEDGKVVNDYLKGFPFVRIVNDNVPPVGVARARTIGTQHARAPLIFYLDADDFLQPLALDIFYKAYQETGGWLYSDWYDHLGELKEAKEWNPDELCVKMLGPMTGLYPKEAIMAVGGFDDFGGWEDWDLHLSLLGIGCCGTRIAHPLFTYRYYTGTRREDNLEKAEKLIKYIKNKHKHLERGDVMAGCRTCGRGGGKRSVRASSARSSSSKSSEYVLMEYTGPRIQYHRMRSKWKRSKSYRYGGNPGADTRKFYAYAQDVKWLLSYNTFRVVPEPSVDTGTLTFPYKLEAKTPPVPSIIETEAPKDISITLLDLPPETITILESAGFDVIEKIKRFSSAQLVSIKGIGPARAKKIKEAVDKFEGN